jgi:hypothetical protein
MSAAPVLAKIRKISLEVVSGPLQGEVFHFTKPLVLVGRGLENDLIIEGDSKISRMHFEIRQSNGAVTIHNVTDKNSLLVNGQTVKVAAIDGEVRVLVGSSELRVQVEPTVGAAPKPMQVIQGGASPQAASAIASGISPARMPPSLHSLPSRAGVPPAGASPGRVAPPKPPGRAASKPVRPKVPSTGISPRVRFYLVIGVVVGIGALFLGGNGNQKKKEQQEIRNSEEVQKDLKLSTESSSEIEKRLQREGVDQLTYQTAQEEYIRGFRDYRQGQYGRAIHELRAALTYYQQHELARHYLTLAQRKLDEMVREEMDLGNKYKGQGSFHMCVASFKKVVMLLDNPEDPMSKQAKQFWNECELEQRERY